MKHYSTLSILAGICLLTGTSTLVAQKTGEADVPRTISYQGVLTSTDGTPLFDGEHSITVTLYSDPAGTIPLWQDTYNTITSKGIFNLYLGTNKPLPTSAQMNRPLWVGTAINGTEEMRPLTPLSASPYALNLPDHAVTTDKLADGAVTAEKVEMDYVSGIAVNGQPISAKGTVLNLVGTPAVPLSYDESTGNIVIGKPASAGQMEENEKGTSVLHNPGTNTGTEFLWSLSGDGWDDINNVGVQADNNDWIGTSANYNFTIAVNNSGASTGGNQRVMQYQPNTVSANILGGHNSNSIGTGVGNIIAGGGSTTGANTIMGNANYGAIGGGESNSIGSATQWAVIAGGHGNRATASHATIGGGHFNAVTAGNGTLGGGWNNLVSQVYGTLGGGLDNVVTGVYATLGGGTTNSVNGAGATIGGGAINAVMGDYSTISGGVQNTERGFYDFLGGGWQNSIDTLSDYSVIGGGAHNTINQQSNWGVVAGGDHNIIDQQSNWGVVAGGDHNSIATLTDRAVISGGNSNQVLSGANGSVIGGGESNMVDVNSAHSTIGGGSQNSVTGFDNVLGGGLQNIIRANAATISGGVGNTVDGYNGQINGGRGNTVSAGGHTGIIVGGHLNRVEALESSVGGGRENEIEGNAEKSVISGGAWNTIQQDIVAGAIGGGTGNLLRTSSTISLSAMTIPGGDNLIAQSWAQTVVGGWNTPKGAIPTRYGTVPPTGGLRNAPIFIIGNGYDDNNRSNAFEVSYNGHSIVFDNNGTGGATGGTGRRAVRGGTYTDNVIYGWAEVSATGTLSCDDFGIASITNPTTGTYRITLNPGGPDGLTGATISCGAAVATLSTGTDPGVTPAPVCNTFIRTSTIQNNVFEVYISQYNPFSQSCEAVNAPFKFHVTGRVSQ